MKQLILIGLLFVSGCVFYRKDITFNPDTNEARESTTAWTLFKNFAIQSEPNSLSYSSQSKDIKVITPTGVASTSSE